MLNGQWLNAGPLNSSGLGSARKELAAVATATATFDALGLRRRSRLSVAATATGTFEALSVTRRRGLAVDATATAEIFGGMSVEIGGVVHAYLAAFPTATAATDVTLHASCPLAADLAATAATDVPMARRRRLGADATAVAAFDTPFLSARVNLGELPPGQDSIIGSKNIRAFGFASATLKKRKRLAVNASATAVMSPLPRLRMSVRLAVNATATAVTAVALYPRDGLAIDASATATIDAPILFTFLQLQADMTATAVVDPTLYLNIFDMAPPVRTVIVPYQPRTAYPTRIRREVDA